jgi:hypothetical protein
VRPYAIRGSRHPVEVEADALWLPGRRDVGEGLLRVRLTAKLLARELGPWQPALRYPRLEPERTPAYLGFEIGPLPQRPLQAPFADKAPGTDDVGVHIYDHRFISFSVGSIGRSTTISRLPSRRWHEEMSPRAASTAQGRSQESDPDTRSPSGSATFSHNE